MYMHVLTQTPKEILTQCETFMIRCNHNCISNKDNWNLQIMLIAFCISTWPFFIHILGVSRSPSILVVNRRSFSGTKAHRAGSGGGADVMARNSLPTSSHQDTGNNVGKV